jgi:catecholate siderophore receptor
LAKRNRSLLRAAKTPADHTETKNQRCWPVSWPVSYRWVAVGTLVAYSAIGAKQVANAQVLPVSAPPPESAPGKGSRPVRRFSIPAEPLGEALSAFEATTGVSVSVPEEGMRAIRCEGVSGSYTPEQALDKLLAQTGLTWRFTSATTAQVQLVKVATVLEVGASANAIAASMAKYPTDPLDTAQTINAVSQQVLQEQGVTTLRDALRNVAGISLAAGEGGAQGDNLTIRGFTARNDLFIDGMRDFGSYYRDPFNTEEVEVLQGPSSVTFGRGSTGGVANQASKTPGLTRFISGDVGFGTDLTRRLALDIDQPISKWGNGAAFRVNLMGNMGNVAGRDVAENRRFGIAPSLSLGLNTDTRWTFSYFHQNAHDNPDYGIPWLFNRPAPVPRNSYYGFKNGNYLRTYDDIGTVRAERDVNSHVTLRNQVRYANYVRDVLITEPQTAGATLSTPLDAMQVTRHEIGVNSVETDLDEQLDLTANFKTGFIQHTLVTGIEATRETSDPTRPTWSNVPTTSLLDPDFGQALTGTAPITSIVHTTAYGQSAYILDTLRLDSHWIVSGGMRWDRFDSRYAQSVAPVSAFTRVDEMPSWRAAIVYKPVEAGSIYFDAGTSFNPSAESLSLSTSTVGLPPEKNQTYEFGTKWDFPQRRLSVEAAVFRTTKLNAREPDPNNPTLNVLAGTQRVNGAQLQVRSHLMSRWDLLAGYANLDGRVVNSQYYPAAMGALLANVPRNTFNFWSTLRLPWHLELGAGGNYVSSRTASSTAPFDPVTGLVKQVPGYWVFNAMASRRISEHLEVQVNVNNIANRYYYDELHPAHIVPGPGRSALIGLKFKF